MLPLIINKDIKEKELKKYCYVISSDLKVIALSVVGYLTNFSYEADPDNYIGIKIIDQEGDIYEIKNISNYENKESIELKLEDSDIEKEIFIDLLSSTFYPDDNEETTLLTIKYIKKRLVEKLTALNDIKEIFSELNKDLNYEEYIEDYMWALHIFPYNEELKRKEMELFEKELIDKDKNRNKIFFLITLSILGLSTFFVSFEKTLFYTFCAVIGGTIGYLFEKNNLIEVKGLEGTVLINNKLKEEELYEQPSIVKVNKKIKKGELKKFNIIYKDHLLCDKKFKLLIEQKEEFEKIKKTILSEINMISGLYFSTITDLKTDIMKELKIKIKKTNNIREIIDILEK